MEKLTCWSCRRREREKGEAKGYKASSRHWFGWGSVERGSSIGLRDGCAGDGGGEEDWAQRWAWRDMAEGGRGGSGSHGCLLGGGSHGFWGCGLTHLLTSLVALLFGLLAIWSFDRFRSQNLACISHQCVVGIAAYCHPVHHLVRYSVNGVNVESVSYLCLFGSKHDVIPWVLC